MTLKQRRIDVDATASTLRRRCINVMCPLGEQFAQMHKLAERLTILRIRLSSQLYVVCSFSSFIFKRKACHFFFKIDSNIFFS